MAKRFPEERWARLLAGEERWPYRSRRLLGAIPAAPRCKLCAAPFAPPGSILMRALGGGPSAINRRICRWCIRSLEKEPAGAQVNISLLFADVRGSTLLAERTSPDEFSRLMARFYTLAARVVDRRDGIVDKFVGDEVVALFIPGFAGPDHAAKAVATARDLVAETAAGDGGAALPVGAGVHSGVAFVGRVGEGEALDFTALGDSVNTTARLASAAGAGEILVSEAAAQAAGLDADEFERRRLALRGREGLDDALVITAAPALL